MTQSLESYKWCIVGPGTIAAVFAQAIDRSGSGQVAYVHGRSEARGTRFCKRYGGEFTADLAKALRHADALYVATPHTIHAAFAEAGLRAGLAVLCEKPMTVTPKRSQELYSLARAKGLPLLEAWMYRCHPQIARAKALLAQGAIGTPTKFRSWFGFAAPFEPESRLYSAASGGGGIFDVGGYPISAALSFLGQFDPEVVGTRGVLAPTGVDQSASITLRFTSGVVAEISVAINEETGTGISIEGDQGELCLPTPFLVEGHNFGRRGMLRIINKQGRVREESIESKHSCYALEARALIEMLRQRRPEAPAGMVGEEESIAIATYSEVWRQRLNVATAQDEPFSITEGGHEQD